MRHSKEGITKTITNSTMLDEMIRIGDACSQTFRKYRYPVIVALPDNSWKWCYIGKLYG